MIVDVPLESITDNPFNPRLQIEQEEIKRLSSSLGRIGQLSPVKVRKIRSGNNEFKFQLVYGHRRVRAAKLLGWASIKAELDSVSNDEDMLTMSLAENIDRENLSDFERALSFSRLMREFGWTYEKIGSVVNFSRSHICNFIRMAQMFDRNDFEKDPTLMEDLRQITEHHARFLLRIDDAETRKNVLHFVVRENVSVRDLQRMIQKLPGWFKPRRTKGPPNSTFPVLFRDEEDFEVEGKRSQDIKEIRKILETEFKSPTSGDFQAFRDSHAAGSGFSLYSSDPPFERLLIENEALEWEKHWFYSSTIQLPIVKLRNTRIQFVSKVALATLFVDVNYPAKKQLVRGTVVFVRRSGKWKILHEHWSDCGDH